MTRSHTTLARLDPATVRARLDVDRTWAAFSLADLDPPFAQHASWFGAPGADSVVLVYRAFDPPLLVCHGLDADLASFSAAVEALAPSTAAYVTARGAWLPLVAARLARFTPRPMVRMRLETDRFHAATSMPVVRLGPSDLPALEALYREEPPAFFLPAHLEHAVYFGVRLASGDLVSVAGTHVLSARSGVAAVGNVHTRRDHRGRGLAQAVTTAVAGELLHRGITTIVLNIVSDNEAARRVYARVGFREYCAYQEGLAWVPAPTPGTSTSTE